MVDENLYKEWVDFIFKEENIDSDLYDDEFEANDGEIIELIKQTCLRCGSDLISRSNKQIYQGLSRIFDPSIDNYVHSFKKSDLDCKEIVAALQSIQHLYLDLFNTRCDPVLSHIDEPTDNSLNSICYMLWDVTPLSFWDFDSYSKQRYSAIASVMEKALNLPNPACIESALHGLGHIHCKAEESVERIIKNFLKKNKRLRPELVQYANNAKIGYIQ